MFTNICRLLVPCAIAQLCCGLALSPLAGADSFGSTYYDHAANELVVTMVYTGTNPNHKFILQWGSCQSADSHSEPTVDALVLDDQFEDAAQWDYRTVERFSLADIPCPRPVTVNLYTAPRVFLPIKLPK